MSAKTTVRALHFLLLFAFSKATAQQSFHVLFLGNSYTATNNLPQLLHDIALSAGDTLVFDSNAPGGYQLIDHSIDVNSQNKIMNGGWDYVVIQGQSQEPITHQSQFSNGATALYSQIKQYNSCAVIMPYMTWGRKNGDPLNCPAFPMMCTYLGMDTTLMDRYLSITEAIDGEVCPVSVVWRYIRQYHPGIELYQPDESHPSAAGTYAAACSFYASIFKRDPLLITYDFGLNATDASNIRNAVKTVIFDSLHVWDYKEQPVADFYYQAGSGNNEALFTAISHGVKQDYHWNFGDGATAVTQFAAHTYASDGTYTVTLTTSTCNLQGLHTSIADTVVQFCIHTPTIYISDSILCNTDTLWTQQADSYQWYYYNLLLPETSQFLAGFSQYALSGFSVLSMLNGCAELSEAFTDSPQWSGYYFDAIGDPCAGDTVAFAVLHINGMLAGSETIFWYKNDTLLPFMNNEDTLYITGSGKFECRIINPASDCPFDTTSYIIEYDCSITGIADNAAELITIFPNPASESIAVKQGKQANQEIIRIFSAEGRLVTIHFASSSHSKIPIAGLPDGIYYISVGMDFRSAKKLVKMSAR